jgi:hypothetical protein
MYPSVSTKDPAAVQNDVQRMYLTMSPQGDPEFVPRVFGWTIDCFSGRYPNYQPVDARYHDLEHTLQGTLCLARLLRGRHRTGVQPALTQRVVELALLAILLHDTGYLKTRDDTQGTGAKYTVTHVDRSAAFAGRLLAEKGLSGADIEAVQNMIRCTGVDAQLIAIRFQSELEKIAGFALATADLLGQMAADDYVDKLPTLYAEFEEAVRFTGDKSHFVAGFSSARDLIRRTPAFWEDFVRAKLERDLEGLHRFLNEPYPAGRNDYLERIQANMDRLKQTVVE